jgi:hypothetical protein
MKAALQQGTHRFGLTLDKFRPALQNNRNLAVFNPERLPVGHAQTHPVWCLDVVDLPTLRQGIFKDRYKITSRPIPRHF